MFEHFVEAQKKMYLQARKELRQGFKKSHWMWFIFPQIKGLSQTPIGQWYAIKSQEQAKAYLAHHVLGERLRDISRHLLKYNQGSNADVIFGALDAQKLHASMTLFNKIAPNDVFSEVLNRYFKGVEHPLTLEILKQQEAEKILSAKSRGNSL